MSCYFLLLSISGIESASLTSPALAGEFFTTSTIWETLVLFITVLLIMYLVCLVAPDSSSLFIPPFLWVN